MRPLDLGSLRPGGAATYIMQMTESGDLVQRRGRWASFRIMSIYIQEVAAVSFLAKLPVRNDNTCCQLLHAFLGHSRWLGNLWKHPYLTRHGFFFSVPTRKKLGIGGMDGKLFRASELLEQQAMMLRPCTQANAGGNRSELAHLSR